MPLLLPRAPTPLPLLPPPVREAETEPGGEKEEEEGQQNSAEGFSLKLPPRIDMRASAAFPEPKSERRARPRGGCGGEVTFLPPPPLFSSASSPSSSPSSSSSISLSRESKTFCALTSL